MNFGHCKHCWWWKKTSPISEKGYCFYHRNTTKEQRDALMKAINDAGYEWDTEKEELKKKKRKR